MTNNAPFRSIKKLFYVLSGIAAIAIVAFEINIIPSTYNGILRFSIWIFFVFTVLGDIIIYFWEFNIPDMKEAENTITHILDKACSIMSQDGSIPFRANVFMPSQVNDDNKLVIKYSSTNMKDTEDSDLQLDIWQGSCGTAWGYKAPVTANLSLPEVRGGASWNLTQKQVGVTKNLRAIISYPIRHPIKRDYIVGILNFDTGQDPPNVFFEENSFYERTASNISSMIAMILNDYGHLDTNK